MTGDDAIKIAEQYLKEKKINYVLPGIIERRQEDKIEVVFLNPIALDPDAVIDPPDIRLWVYVQTKNVELIYLM